MTLDELKTLVTPEGVKSALDDQIYDSLAFGDGENVLDSCHQSAIWGYSYLAKTGNITKAFNASEKEVISAALIQRAIYHLNAHHFFDIDNPKEMAQALIDSILGISNSDGKSVFIGAAVAKDEKSNIVYEPSGRPTRWPHR